MYYHIFSKICVLLLLQSDGAGSLWQFERDRIANSSANVAVGKILYRVCAHILDRVHVLRNYARPSSMAGKLGYVHGSSVFFNRTRFG